MHSQLQQAKTLILGAKPDPGLWSGDAARAFSLAIDAALAELEAIQGGLWD